jgi:hypothetical protein
MSSILGLVDASKLDTLTACDMKLVELQVRLQQTTNTKVYWQIKDDMNDVLDRRLSLMQPTQKLPVKRRRVPPLRA